MLITASIPTINVINAGPNFSQIYSSRINGQDHGHPVDVWIICSYAFKYTVVDMWPQPHMSTTMQQLQRIAQQRATFLFHIELEDEWPDFCRFRAQDTLPVIYTTASLLGAEMSSMQLR
jgi:hypothetical protein